MLIVFGIVLAGWLGLYAMKPKPSVCPACGCVSLMPNQGGTKFECQNCREVFRLYMGEFVGRPGIQRALPPASLRGPKS